MLNGNRERSHPNVLPPNFGSVGQRFVKSYDERGYNLCRHRRNRRNQLKFNELQRQVIGVQCKSPRRLLSSSLIKKHKKVALLCNLDVGYIIP